MKKEVIFKTVDMENSDEGLKIVVTEMPAEGLIHLTGIVSKISRKMREDQDFANSLAGFQLILEQKQLSMNEYLYVLPIMISEFSSEFFPALQAFVGVEEAVLRRGKLTSVIELCKAVFECNDFKTIFEEIKNLKGPQK